MVEMMIVMAIRDQKHIFSPGLALFLLNNDEDDNVDGDDNLVVVEDVGEVVLGVVVNIS